MKITRTQKYILYTLGKWYEEANKKIRRPLIVSISKSIFIGLVKTAGIADKQDRALYKNLEVLEKKRLINYQNKELMLSERGRKAYNEISKDIQPYFLLYKKLKEKDPISYTKKLQTIFK